MKRLLYGLSLLGAAALLGATLAACDDDGPDNGDLVVPEIEVSDQTVDPADQVVIDRVVSDGPGWTVIHEDDGEGSPGDVLGVGGAPEGESEDIIVELDRPLVDGETLFAMLHVDMGEVGVYEFPGDDAPATDSDGEVVVAAFTVTVETVEPSIEANDQSVATLDQVTVAQLRSIGPGWVVIHADDGEGSPGEVIGVTAVDDGPASDVVVELDRDVVDGETLFAMLHVDAGEVGVYEFPGDDVPATDSAGDVVVDHFVVTVGGGDPVVEVVDQTLEGLSTLVFVDHLFSVGPGWLVVHADDGSGAPAGVVGVAAVGDGGTDDLMVELERPAADGETLHAMLHVDAGEEGVYEFPGDDAPATDSAGDVVVVPFVVTVPAGTPAARLELTNVGLTAWEVTAVEPESWTEALIGDGGENGTIVLFPEWRYEVVNTVSTAHPFELITRGENPADDIVLLSQAVEGSLEDDAAVDWTDDEAGTARFTMTDPLASSADGYRCSIHSAAMRGAVALHEE